MLPLRIIKEPKFYLREYMPRRDRGFRAGGTDGRARWGRAVSEGLILHAVPYGSLIIAVFYTAKQKNAKKICVCAIFVVPLQPFCGWKASGATKGTTNE